jgi:hypothetical protein
MVKTKFADPRVTSMATASKIARAAIRIIHPPIVDSVIDCIGSDLDRHSALAGELALEDRREVC